MQSKNAAEEAKLMKKQEESEAIRQAHREEARLREEETRRRLEAKVCMLHFSPSLKFAPVCVVSLMLSKSASILSELGICS